MFFLLVAVVCRRPSPDPDRLCAIFLQAAAYSRGGKKYSTLVLRQDKDNSGSLDEDEFYSFIRRVLRLPFDTISDGNIVKLFHVLDQDQSGTVELEELLSFAQSGGGWKGYRTYFN